ncbi:MAG: hypothetical protein ACOX3T_04165 [Bdellovibrionota bacterium]
MINFYEKNYKILYSKFPNIAKSLDKIDDFNDIEVKETNEGRVIFYKNQCLDNAYKPITASKKWLEMQTIEGKNIFIFGFGSGYHVRECIEKNKESSVSVIIPSATLFKKALEINDVSDTLENISNIIFVDDNNLEITFDNDSELLIRPQEQVFFSEVLSKIKTRFFSKKGFSALNPKIGVLGAMSGGTLPMLAYLGNALTNLNQKFRLLDTAPLIKVIIICRA